MDGPVSFPIDPSSSSSLGRWYFDFSPASGSPRSVGSSDWETCESALGISRGLLEILHRVSSSFKSSRVYPPSPALSRSLSLPFALDLLPLIDLFSLFASSSLFSGQRPLRSLPSRELRSSQPHSKLPSPYRPFLRFRGNRSSR